MNSKVISFQVVQGYSYTGGKCYPDVIALCEDGSLWMIGLKEANSGGYLNWKRITPEPPKYEEGFQARMNPLGSTFR